MGERMRLETIGVNATLTMPYWITLLDGREILLKAGSLIHVDQEKGIACQGEHYFEVEPQDYSISFQN